MTPTINSRLKMLCFITDKLYGMGHRLTINVGKQLITLSKNGGCPTCAKLKIRSGNEMIIVNEGYKDWFSRYVVYSITSKPMV